MSTLPWIVAGAPLAVFAYAYVAYPALLRLWAARRAPRGSRREAWSWPTITITVPAYNEAESIRGTIENLLRLDYPEDRRRILIVSDASTDGTDEIVGEYADRGVALLRLPERCGKTAAENAALAHLRGTIVVNTDASVRIDRRALKPLIAAFADPAVGVASGRDVSVAALDDHRNTGESGYVGYEMAIRELETSVAGIVGASGCLYAIRTHLHQTRIPEGLSRDFAAALIAREHGYRAVSVRDAICYVPRTASLRREYRRKVRTFARGMQTLWWKRALLNPLRYGAFSWMLFSHKVCRWLVPWILAASATALVPLAFTFASARWIVASGLPAALAAAAGALWPEEGRVPRALAWPAFFLAGNVAALHASVRVLRRRSHAVWEPTRREAARAT